MTRGGAVRNRGAATQRVSPVVSPARRQAGQGVRERLDDLVGFDAMPWMVAGVAGVCFVIIAWADRWAAWAAPWMTTALGLGLAAVAALRVLRARREAPRWRLGLDGELAVADILDGLRERGYKVLHDIPGERGNVDHVVIGPAGVFAIETKARSKVEGKRNTIRVKGERVCFTSLGQYCDKAIPRAKAAAARIGSTLRERSGIKVYAQAVLVYPGWWVEPSRRDDVWVMNPGQLDYRLERSEQEYRKTLSHGQVERLTGCLLKQK